jgi:hypothetical protein
VHLVRTIVAGQATGPSLEELRSRYAGWAISVEAETGGAAASGRTFLARKQPELH